MTTYIYLDNSIISKEFQEAIIDKIGIDIIFLFNKNVSIEYKFKDIKYIRLPDERDYNFISDSLKALSLIKVRLPKSIADKIEIARYSIHTSNRQIYYHYWINNLIIERFKPMILLWATNHQNNKPSLVNVYSNQNINKNGFQKTYTFKNKPIHLLYKIKSTLLEIKSDFEFKFQSKKSTKKKFEGHRVWFIEQYPNSSIISHNIHQYLSLHDFKSKFIANNSSVFSKSCISGNSNSFWIINLVSSWFYLKMRLKEILDFYVLIFSTKAHDKLLFDLLPNSYWINLFTHVSTVGFYNSIYNKIFEKNYPNLIVSTSVSGFSVRSAVFSAKKFGTKSAFVQHGDNPPYTINRNYLLHDYYLLWGNFDAQIYAKFGGIPNDRIFKTGTIKFNNYKVGKRDNTLSLNNKNQINILYMAPKSNGATTSLEEAHTLYEWVKALNLNQVKIKIKVHPGEKSNVFDHQPKKNISIVKTGNFYELMKASDIVLASASTSGAEACWMDKPLILLQYQNRKFPFPYEKFGSAIIAKSPKLLKEAVNNIIESKETRKKLDYGRKAFVEEVFNSSNGNNMSNICDVLIKLADN